MTGPPDVADVVELARRIDADGELTAGELRRRDRAIGREFESLKGAPRKQILAWLARVSRTENSPLGSPVDRGLRIGAFLLGLAGLVLGGLTASAVFAYTGERPVNVLHVLAVFVGLQLILLAALFLTLLPPSLLRRIPGSRAAAETLRMLSPGRIQKIASRRLPEKYRRQAAALAGTSRAHRLLFGRLEKWLVVTASQIFAVAFNCGALLASLSLVFFSDRAFAWSTTLQVTAADIHALTGTLSAPWKALVPDADPSLSLIEASRYYRLGEGLLPPAGGGTAAGPALLGGWWPFLAMSMLVYGLLPRILLWAFSRWRLQSAVSGAMVHLPGVATLLERMNGEFVETRATETEVSGTGPPGETPPPAELGLRDRSCALISWSDAFRDGEGLSRYASRRWGCLPAGLLAAGGAGSLALDEEAVVRAADLAAGGGGTIVFVRAWEPPLEEFHDFLRALRRALPEGAPIVVAPLGMGSGPEPPPPGEDQCEIWRRGLRVLGDPWLSVESPEGGS